ncbi:MAG TPA: cytochrome c maturation protein CcmE [Candidatus Avidesulfovibrio excrementigallinarum]|nr:cytochrome c maturation protein CcmE [Candidatus Avidesulfovibrio excrementigallinarum]
MAKKTSTSVYIAALLLLLGGVGALLYTGFSEGSVYFLNVKEALAVPAEKLTSARLFGTVAGQNLTRTSDGRTVTFQLVDKDTPSMTMAVTYTGVVPDTFKAGAEVIVEGGRQPDGTFKAATLMTKCPSKYQKENREKNGL